MNREEGAWRSGVEVTDQERERVMRIMTAPRLTARVSSIMGDEPFPPAIPTRRGNRRLGLLGVAAFGAAFWAGVLWLISW